MASVGAGALHVREPVGAPSLDGPVSTAASRESDAGDDEPLPPDPTTSLAASPLSAGGSAVEHTSTDADGKVGLVGVASA